MVKSEPKEIKRLRRRMKKADIPALLEMLISAASNAALEQARSGQNDSRYLYTEADLLSQEIEKRYNEK